jgi:multicomponent Na+:H+ antiporter subunit D
MNVDGLIVLALVIPFAGAALIPLAHAAPNIRETVTLVTATALFATVMLILREVWNGARPAVDAIEVTPGLVIAFKVEPLGMLFAGIAATLWIVNSVYSIGYMRGQQRAAADLLLCLFRHRARRHNGHRLLGQPVHAVPVLRMLSVSTYPLVAHKGNDEARRGARVYLMMLIGASLVLFLPAIVWTYVVAGTLDFVPGGILAGNIGRSAPACCWRCSPSASARPPSCRCITGCRPPWWRQRRSARCCMPWPSSRPACSRSPRS